MAHELAQEIASARQLADTARASFLYTYDRYEITTPLPFFSHFTLEFSYSLVLLPKRKTPFIIQLIPAYSGFVLVLSVWDLRLIPWRTFVWIFLLTPLHRLF